MERKKRHRHTVDESEVKDLLTSSQRLIGIDSMVAIWAYDKNGRAKRPDRQRVKLEEANLIAGWIRDLREKAVVICPPWQGLQELKIDVSECSEGIVCIPYVKYLKNLTRRIMREVATEVYGVREELDPHILRHLILPKWEAALKHGQDITELEEEDDDDDDEEVDEGHEGPDGRVWLEEEIYRSRTLRRDLEGAIYTTLLGAEHKKETLYITADQQLVELLCGRVGGMVQLQMQASLIRKLPGVAEIIKFVTFEAAVDGAPM